MLLANKHKVVPLPRDTIGLLVLTMSDRDRRVLHRYKGRQGYLHRQSTKLSCRLQRVKLTEEMKSSDLLGLR